MKSLFDEHFEALRAAYSGTAYMQRADGSRLIKIPNYALRPRCWNSIETTVYFLAVPSYPLARPDCFWTDPQLKLASGGPPQNTSINNNHGGPESLLWFSWHVAKWDPNHDTLLTYLKVIDRRLQECK
jgi:Prokaryotic E2 family E